MNRESAEASIALTIRKRIAFAVVAACLAVTAGEVILRFAGGIVIHSRIGFLLWTQDEGALRAGYASYLRRRDPVLGWPTTDALKTAMYGPGGARPGPAFSASDEPCVDTFGDSFVYSEDVDDAHAWEEVAARQLGCRVANYGVGGYGTDQALLRSERIGARARVAILGIHPENAMRNVNQYRQFLGDAPYTFKPRYLLEPDGSLRLVPLPTLSDEAVNRVATDPAVLPYETFRPGSADGPVPWRMPYSLALLRVVLHPRLVARVRGGTSWGAFLSPTHPSGALPLTVALASEFDRRARARGATQVFVLVFTTPASQFQHHKTGIWAEEPLVTGLSARGMAVLDLGPIFEHYLAERSICTVMRYPAQCDGHYNDEGYALVGRSVAAFIDASRREAGH
ncbi:MAG: hypothetical protein ACHQO8_13005 [Vicinamibacterales bacterium]